MSLSSDITTLVSRVDALIQTYETRAAGINAALAAALATVSVKNRRVYLDQINGSDANDGLTVAKAVQSLTRALALGGENSSVDIVLMNDYTMTQGREELYVGQMVHLKSYGTIEGSVKFKLNLGLHAFGPDPVHPGDWTVGGFALPSWGMNTLNLHSIEVVFPAAPATGIMANDTYNGLLDGNATTGPGLVGMELNFCTIVRPPGSVGVVSGIRTHFVGLFVKSSTFVTADLAGKWVASVAAGSTPASIGWVASNLTTL